MNTLFVVPEIRLDSKPTNIPFWAGNLASIVEQKNGNVAILDLNALRMKFGGEQVPNKVISDEIFQDGSDRRRAKKIALKWFGMSKPEDDDFGIFNF